MQVPVHDCQARKHPCAAVGIQDIESAHGRFNDILQPRGQLNTEAGAEQRHPAAPGVVAEQKGAYPCLARGVDGGLGRRRFPRAVNSR